MQQALEQQLAFEPRALQPVYLSALRRQQEQSQERALLDSALHEWHLSGASLAKLPDEVTQAKADGTLKAWIKQASDEWYTPNTPGHPILDLVAKGLGGQIGLDAHADPEHRVPALAHYTKADDCFKRDCQGMATFQQPPFSNPKLFIEWLCKNLKSGSCSEAIGLYKQGVISNQGSGPLLKRHASRVAVWHRNGRIKFLPGERLLIARALEGKAAPRGADFDTVFCYFGQNPERFERVFSPYGWIFKTC